MTEGKLPTSGGSKGSIEQQRVVNIEADIDRTRSAISGDIQSLGQKLSPDNLKAGAKEVLHEAKDVAEHTLHQAKEVATETFREVKDDAMETVSAKVSEFRGDVRRVEQQAVGFLRENAIPLALMGAGLIWFVSNRREREQDHRWEGSYRPRDEGDWSYPERRQNRVGQWVEEGSHKAGAMMSRARHFAEREGEHARQMARDAAHDLGDAASRARGTVKREFYQARDVSRRTMETHPLAVGAAVLAAGVGVGLLLPATSKEKELLGAPGERLVNEARGAVQEFGHAAQSAARDIKTALTNNP